MWVRHLEEAGLFCSLRIRDGEGEEANLTLIGRGVVTEPLGRLRTLAYGIISRSPCPVPSVRAAPGYTATRNRAPYRGRVHPEVP
jgi:hypothetical protein